MKSKLNIRSILIIAIIGIVSLVYFNPSFAANQAKVNVETVNIRKTADSNANIVEQASKGEKVEIIEKTGNWYKVKYNGIQGYIRQDLLDVDGEIATESADATTTASESNTAKTETSEASNTQTATEISETPNTQEVEEEKTEQPEDAKQESLQENLDKKQEATETQNSESVVYTCKENTKLKIMPLILGNDIQELKKDATVSVLEINNKWALVESETNRGWVLASKIEKTTDVETNATAETTAEPEEVKEEGQEEKTQEEPQVTAIEVSKTMYVNSEVVNLRKDSDKESESIAKLAKGTQVTVTAEMSNGWSKVKISDKEGYILSTLLSDKKPEVATSRKSEEARQDSEADKTQDNNSGKTQDNDSNKKEDSTEKPSTDNGKTEPASTSNKGQEVCNYAKQFLGCKYVYGGTSPSGFDCSGFTQYVFKHFGVTLNRTAEAQASNGTYVAKSNLKAGDLLIFTSHAGIYLGNGTFIHAANPSKGVIITSLSDSYYVKHYITARRIFN